MGDLELLEKTQKLMQAEQKLTALLEKVEPWLSSSASRNTKNRSAVMEHYSKRVRPIPKDMKQVDVILAMARNWASRTSAPSGWESTAPVIGFATPNPLPHQLRGGALAALQLERATTKKYRSQQQQREEAEQESKRTKQQQDQAAVEEKKRLEKKQIDEAVVTMNPKKRPHDPDSSVVPQQPRAKPHAAPSVGVTMNLSDSSSSESEDDDDE